METQAMTKTYIVRFFRQRPGDVPARNVATASPDLDTVGRFAAEALLAHFNDPAWTWDRRPDHAQVIDDTDGSVALRLMIAPNGEVEQFP